MREGEYQVCEGSGLSQCEHCNYRTEPNRRRWRGSGRVILQTCKYASLGEEYNRAVDWKVWVPK